MNKKRRDKMKRPRGKERIVSAFSWERAGWSFGLLWLLFSEICYLVH